MSQWALIALDMWPMLQSQKPIRGKAPFKALHGHKDTKGSIPCESNKLFSAK